MSEPRMGLICRHGSLARKCSTCGEIEDAKQQTLESVADQLLYCRDDVDTFKVWLKLQIGDYEPKDPYRDESGP